MSEMMSCPHCGGSVAVTPEVRGRAVTCVHCRKEFTVPAAPQAGGMPPAAAAESKHTLLVVIAVVIGGVILLAILGAGFFIPALLKAQEFARRAACMKNIQQIGLAMRKYAGDYDDAFMPLVDENGNTVPTGREILPTLPARTGFAVLLKHGYLKVPKALVCPSSADKMPALAEDLMKMSLKDLVPKENACSYGWDPTKTHNADETCAILADKPEPNANHSPGDAAGNSPNHGKGGQNIFYNDGHTRWATTPAPDTPVDTDIYLGGTGYEKSTTDAKIIR